LSHNMLRVWRIDDDDDDDGDDSDDDLSDYLDI
jgi:hypothetical protein